MIDLLSNLVLWCLLHQQTLIALTLTPLIAFVGGAAYQFCIDDKQKGSQSAGTR